MEGLYIVKINIFFRNNFLSFAKVISYMFIIILLFSGCTKQMDKNASDKKEIINSHSDVNSGAEAPEMTSDSKTGNRLDAVSNLTEPIDENKTNNTEAQITANQNSDKDISEQLDNSKTNSIEKVEEKTIDSTTESNTQNSFNTITLSIIGPRDRGTFLMPEKIKIKTGDTVYDVLKRTLEQKKIPFEYSGRKNSVYFESINNVGEFDYGQQSGWIYRVNGVMPNISAGEYEVKDKDIIEWFYTVNLGKEFIDK